MCTTFLINELDLPILDFGKKVFFYPPDIALLHTLSLLCMHKVKCYGLPFFCGG